MRKLLIRIPFWLPGGLLLAGDQLSKYWADHHLQHLKRYPFLGQDLLVLTRYHNLGLIFGRYSAVPQGFIEKYTTYFPTLFWLAMLGCAIWRRREASRVEMIAWTTLILSSASNLLDQWRLGVVIDTLQMYVGGPEYMPFNLADVGIVSALGVLMVSLFRWAFAPEAPQ